MRVTSAAAIFALASVACAQAWEKPIAPGLVYRAEVDLATPRVFHAFRLNLRSGIRLESELAGGKVYAADQSKGRETVSESIRRTGAIAGINGDFFPYTGDPLGLMVRNGELLSEPYKSRPVLAWGKGYASIASTKYAASLIVANREPAPVDGINRECGPGQLILFTAESGIAISKPDNVFVYLKVDDDVLEPDGRLIGVVESLTTNQGDTQVPDGYAVLCATGQRQSQISFLRVGDRVKVEARVTGVDWKKAQNALGGGSMLVHAGAVKLDAAEQGFNVTFTDRRHPRSAVGITAGGEVWLVACEGRLATSDGATLKEMADMMLRLGCVEAMNLDGGGSTSANLYGFGLSRPSDGVERPVSNMLLLFSDQSPSLDQEPLGMTLPSFAVAGSAYPMSIVREDGSGVPNADIVWWATGPAWIDQGGLLHVLGDGIVTIGAVVAGRPLVGTLQTLPAGSTPPPE